MMTTLADRCTPLQSILADYELGEIVESAPLEGGMFTRPIKLVTSTGCFVVRENRFRATPEQFQFQAHVMNGAAERGTRCPRILADRRGRLSRQVGDRLFAVCEFVDGGQLNWPQWCRRLHQEPHFAEQLGAEVAALHNTLAELTPDGLEHLSIELPPIQFRYLDKVRNNWESRLHELESGPRLAAEQSRQALLNNRAVIDDHWVWLTRQAAALHIAELPCQIVHGDISPVNLIRRDDGTWEFIDWDCCHINHRLYDALGDVMIRPPADDATYHRLHTEPVRRYLGAYCAHSSRSVADHEFDCVPVFCLARQLEDLRQRLDVLPCLSPVSDAGYARLIEIRLSLMHQIRQTPAADWRS